MEQTKGPLVDHLSPSSIYAYLNDPMYFKFRYIMGQRDRQFSATGVIGTAGHKALEKIYSGVEISDAIAAGQREIENIPDNGIKYGKQIDCREKLVLAYIKAINLFVSELPAFHKIISIEEQINTDIRSEFSDSNLPLSMHTRLDLLTANNLNELEIIDYKFVYNYTNADEDNFKRWLQGLSYYYAVKARYGIAATRIKFLECKTSQNRDGSSQIKPWTMEFSNKDDFKVFERLYNDVVLDMNNPGRLFLPNPGDIFNGQDMFEIYRQELMPIDAPISVRHRTEQAEFVERQFVASDGNSPETANYTPEERIRRKLNEFGVVVEMRDTHVGPSVIRYTMEPSRYTRVSRVKQHEADIALILKAESVRIEAPIPGTNRIGIEVPNKDRKAVPFINSHLRPGTLQIPIGVNVIGDVVHANLADMPHLLIAGQTGSGKSVMLNVILQSITQQLTPAALQLVLIDPKQVEFAAYNNLSHLINPVVNDNHEAAKILDSTTKEMESRYKMLKRRNTRNIEEYNRKPGNKMPYRVVILDEFADLMMSAEKQTIDKLDLDLLKENILSNLGPRGISKKCLKSAIEQTTKQSVPPSAQDSIIRLAQKARAVGIHLILATQRPSADVVTGLIKANIPTKIAFTVTSSVNSKIIIDQVGAEALTGKGDMLYQPVSGEIQRLQGLYA